MDTGANENIRVLPPEVHGIAAHEDTTVVIVSQLDGPYQFNTPKTRSEVKHHKDDDDDTASKQKIGGNMRQSPLDAGLDFLGSPIPASASPKPLGLPPTSPPPPAASAAAGQVTPPPRHIQTPPLSPAGILSSASEARQLTKEIALQKTLHSPSSTPLAKLREEISKRGESRDLSPPRQGLKKESFGPHGFGPQRRNTYNDGSNSSSSLTSLRFEDVEEVFHLISITAEKTKEKHVLDQSRSPAELNDTMMRAAANSGGDPSSSSFSPDELSGARSEFIQSSSSALGREVTRRAAPLNLSMAILRWCEEVLLPGYKVTQESVSKFPGALLSWFDFLKMLRRQSGTQPQHGDSSQGDTSQFEVTAANAHLAKYGLLGHVGPMPSRVERIPGKFQHYAAQQLDVFGFLQAMEQLNYQHQAIKPLLQQYGSGNANPLTDTGKENSGGHPLKGVILSPDRPGQTNLRQGNTALMIADSIAELEANRLLNDGTALKLPSGAISGGGAAFQDYTVLGRLPKNCLEVAQVVAKKDTLLLHSMLLDDVAEAIYSFPVLEALEIYKEALSMLFYGLVGAESNHLAGLAAALTHLVRGGNQSVEETSRLEKTRTELLVSRDAASSPSSAMYNPGPKTSPDEMRRAKLGGLDQLELVLKGLGKRRPLAGQSGDSTADRKEETCSFPTFGLCLESQERVTGRSSPNSNLPHHLKPLSFNAFLDAVSAAAYLVGTTQPGDAALELPFVAKGRLTALLELAFGPVFSIQGILEHRIKEAIRKLGVDKQVTNIETSKRYEFTLKSIYLYYCGWGDLQGIGLLTYRKFLRFLQDLSVAGFTFGDGRRNQQQHIQQLAGDDSFSKPLPSVVENSQETEVFLMVARQCLFLDPDRYKSLLPTEQHVREAFQEANLKSGAFELSFTLFFKVLEALATLGGYGADSNPSMSISMATGRNGTLGGILKLGEGKEDQSASRIAGEVYGGTGFFTSRATAKFLAALISNPKIGRVHASLVSDEAVAASAGTTKFNPPHSGGSSIHASPATASVEAKQILLEPQFMKGIRMVFEGYKVKPYNPSTKSGESNKQASSRKGVPARKSSGPNLQPSSSSTFGHHRLPGDPPLGSLERSAVSRDGTYSALSWMDVLALCKETALVPTYLSVADVVRAVRSEVTDEPRPYRIATEDISIHTFHRILLRLAIILGANSTTAQESVAESVGGSILTSAGYTPTTKKALCSRSLPDRLLFILEKIGATSPDTLKIRLRESGRTIQLQPRKRIPSNGSVKASPVSHHDPNDSVHSMTSPRDRSPSSSRTSSRRVGKAPLVSSSTATSKSTNGLVHTPTPKRFKV